MKKQKTNPSIYFLFFFLIILLVITSELVKSPSFNTKEAVFISSPIQTTETIKSKCSHTSGSLVRRTRHYECNKVYLVESGIMAEPYTDKRTGAILYRNSHQGIKRTLINIK